MSSPRASVLATLAAFATFGAFWGVWGASIPRVRDQASVSEGELGIALLCVGLGALPAMLATGRVLDRWGLRITATLIAALGIAGLGVAVTADGLASLAIGLVIVGMTSGAADVAMNSVAGRAEQDAGRPIITRAHGALSAFVVLGSLLTAAVAGLDRPLWVPFAVVAMMAVLAGAALWVTLPTGTQEHPDEDSSQERATGMRGGATAALLAIGVLGALAFASESAHQNWSALFARDELGAGDGQAALAPALFATIVSISRLTIGAYGATHARLVLVGGGFAAAAGSMIVGVASGPVTFVGGLAVAAAGTAVLFPTVLGLVSRNVVESRRGRATSLVSTVAYLGFLMGPAYVGAWADAYDLRVAMAAVAALAVVLAALTPLLMRRAGLTRTGSAA